MFKCDICNQTFDKECSMKTHTTKKHATTNYNCDLCARSFSYLKNLRIHKKNHQDDKIVRVYDYFCSDCSFTAWRKSYLIDHFNATHLNVKISCDFCSYQANSRGTLRMHKRSTHMNIRYPCELCDYQAKTSGNLKTHINSVHEKLRLYKCNECNYSANYKKHLKTHISGIHLKERIECPQCNMTLAKTSFNSHCKRVHSGKKQTKMCPICKKELCNLSKHMEIHSNSNMTLKCPECEHTTNTKRKLKSHTESVHLKPMRRCKECPFEAKIRTLYQHINTVHKGIRFSCKECEYTTTQASHLKAHVKHRHSFDFETFDCTQCNYKAQSKRDITLHTEVIHIGVKLPCDRCDYVGSSAGALKLHKNKHKGKNFKCKVCDYTTTDKSHLKAHAGKHIGIRYPCDECEKTFLSKFLVKMHKDAKHRQI